MPLRFATVTGRVVIDPQGGQPPAPGAFRIIAMPFPMPNAYFPMGPPPELRDDFSFEVLSAPGPTMFNVSGAGGFVVKSMHLNGLDITDTGVEIPAGAKLGGLEIEITDRVPMVTGAVTDGRGGLSADSTVVFLSADRERWFETGRGVLASRPDREGRFRMRLTRPGDYLAVAVDYFAADQMGNRDYLQSLAALGTRVSVD